MRTDKQVHQLLEATPDLLIELGAPLSPGRYEYVSLTLKESEQRLDGLMRGLDGEATQAVVEVQFYRDDWIFDRVLSERHRLRCIFERLNVEAIVVFGDRRMEPVDHPDRTRVTVIYLDEALENLRARNPEHPALAAFAPLLTRDSSEVVSKCSVWYNKIQSSNALDPKQRARYEQVFFSWAMQRLGLKDLQDLDMLITDLPELEDTDFYRLVKEKWLRRGVEEGLVRAVMRLGRQRWGAESEDISKVLNTLTTEELEALMDQMPKLSGGWDDLRRVIPVKPVSR